MGAGDIQRDAKVQLVQVLHADWGWNSDQAPLEDTWHGLWNSCDWFAQERVWGGY